MTPTWEPARFSYAKTPGSLCRHDMASDFLDMILHNKEVRGKVGEHMVAKNLLEPLLVLLTASMLPVIE